MPYADPEIPALPVLVPLVLLALLATVAWLHRRAAVTAPRVAVGALTAVYGAGVLGATLLPLPVNGGAAANGVPWWTYVQPIPLVAADPVGVALNLALFVPLGLLLPLVARTTTARRVAAFAFAVSLTIESLQLLGDATVSYGRVFDVDDLIANTAGAVAGFLLLRVVVGLPEVGELVQALQWPGPPTEVYRPVYPAATVGSCPPPTSRRPG